MLNNQRWKGNGRARQGDPDRDPSHSFQPTNAHSGVFVRALHIQWPRLFHHHPIHAVTSLELAEVGSAEGLPSSLSFDLCAPTECQPRHLSSDRRILGSIGQGTTLSRSAEAVEVFSRTPHVVCAQGKVTVRRGMVANPDKRLHP